MYESNADLYYTAQEHAAECESYAHVTGYDKGGWDSFSAETLIALRI